MVRGAGKRSEGCTNGQRGALYDTAMIICKGCVKMVRGWENGQGGGKTIRGVHKRSEGCII